MADGVHYRAALTLTRKPLNVRIAGYAKRLSEVPGVDGAVRARGGGLGLGAPVWPGARLEVAGVLENRSEDGPAWWVHTIWAAVQQTLPGDLRLELRGGAGRGTGGLLLAEPGVDTLVVSGGGETTLTDPRIEPRSVRVDAFLRTAPERPRRGAQAPLHCH
jgi:hypothetical protein